MGTEISKLFVTIAAKTDDFVKGVGDVNKKLMGVGAAMGAVGAAGLKMVDSAREINSQLQSTGVTIGATTTEMRNMVLECANVTFGIDSVTKTFDLLARAGIENQDEMIASANAFDALADATGSSAEVVADQLIPAFKAMGERIPTSTAEMDKFTWLVKNTTTDISEFAMAMNYVAMYGEGLNITLDEMIAIMAVLESKGKGGATATRLFRTAVNQAKDGSVSLNEALGITQEEIDGYIQKMQSATGITEQHANALNEQYGVMDKLRFLWSKMQFVIGSVLTPLEPVFAIMTAMTPVMIFLSTSIGRNALAWMAHSAAVMKSHINTVMHIGSSNVMTGTLAAQYQATALATGAQHGLNAAMKANPIIAIIAAIAGLIALLVQLWKNWESITLSMEAGWIKFKQLLGKGLEADQIRLDMITLELEWRAVQKAVKDDYDTMVSEATMATDTLIRNAEMVAEAEISSLKERADFYRKHHYEKMDMLDEEMMAEIRALDPVLAAELEGYNQEIEGLQDRKKAREEEAEKDRVRALQKELRDSDTTKARKNEIKRELEEAEDAAKQEEIILARNNAIAEANLEDKIDVQIRGQGLILEAQKNAYEDDLVAFKQLNIDKLTELESFVKEYNQILSGAGFTPSVEIGMPSRPAPTTQASRPANLKEFFDLNIFPGMASGGWITEPSLLYGINSGQMRRVAEAGPEYVSPGGTGETYNFQVVLNNPVVREEQDIQKITRQVMVETERMYTRRARGRGL